MYGNITLIGGGDKGKTKTPSAISIPEKIYDGVCTINVSITTELDENVNPITKVEIRSNSSNNMPDNALYLLTEKYLTIPSTHISNWKKRCFYLRDSSISAIFDSDETSNFSNKYVWIRLYGATYGWSEWICIYQKPMINVCR